MAVSESRYNAVGLLGDKKDTKIQEKNALLLELTDAQNKLDLRKKRVAEDKANIIARAEAEQVSLKQQNEKRYQDTLKAVEKQTTKRVADYEKEINDLKEQITSVKEYAAQTNEVAKENYEAEKVKVDNWVKDASKRADSVDRQTEEETLRVKGLKEGLEIKVKTIDEQIKNIDQTMKNLIDISLQAPPSTK